MKPAMVHIGDWLFATTSANVRAQTTSAKVRGQTTSAKVRGQTTYVKVREPTTPSARISCGAH